MRLSTAKGMRFEARCVMTCLVAAVAAVGAQGVAAQTKVLRNAVFWGPDSAVTKEVMDPWSNEVEARSGNRIKIERFYAGSLVKGPEQYEALASGAADISTVIPAYERGKFYVQPLLDLPFALPEDVEASHKVAKAIYTKWVNPHDIHQNILMLTYDPTTQYRFISKRKLSTLADLKGLKFRSAGGSTTDAIKALGGTPVNVAPAEIYEGMSRGVVDGTFHTLSGAWDWKYYELADYATAPGLGVAMLSMAMSRKAFDALDKDLQAVILQVSEKYQGAMTRSYAATEARHMGEMGIELMQLPPEEVAKAAAVLIPMYSQWMEALAKERKLDGKLILRDLVASWRENGQTPPEWMVKLSN